MAAVSQVIQGWGRFPREECWVERPETLRQLQDGLRRGLGSGRASYIARGLGRSYGDSSLNLDAGVIDQTRLDRFIAFDKVNGILECEAGVSFGAVLEAIIPHGWFVPTTPGTKFVTIGGAVAADVHGKNHHADGSFGGFIDHLDLLVASGEVLRCSPSENSDVFWATIGGMGLTGIILTVRFRLHRIECSYYETNYIRAKNIDELLTAMNETEGSHRYSVAWVDGIASGANLGRSVLMVGNDARVAELPSELSREPLVTRRPGLKGALRGNVPMSFPNGTLNHYSVTAFNTAFYASQRPGTRFVDFDTYFYPLDRIRNWNRIYGGRGFIQYQALFPKTTAREGLVEMLECIATSRRASFLSVLKSSGAANEGLLSYLYPGQFLAMDFPHTGDDMLDFTRQLDRILLRHGGRLYLAKDSMMSAEMFREMYPKLDDFISLKARIDPEQEVRFVAGEKGRVGLMERILVLGATSGIARAVCRQFAGRGCALVLAGRNAEELERMASDLRIRHDIDCRAEPFEALDFDQHAAFVDRCLEGGAFDGALLCFGYLGDQERTQSDFDEARRTIDVNFTSAVSVLNLLANYFETRRAGWIAVVSSVAGDRGRQSNYTYGAAKAGLTTYVAGLRNRLCSKGVHVVTVKPGFVDTAMVRGIVNPNSPLLTPPEVVAAQIDRAIKRREDVVYTPGYWRAIMTTIKVIPEFVFKRLKL